MKSKCSASRKVLDVSVLKEHSKVTSHELEKRYEQLSIFYQSSEGVLRKEGHLQSARNYLAIILSVDTLLGQVEDNLKAINPTYDMEDKMCSHYISLFEDLIPPVTSICKINMLLKNHKVRHLKAMILSRIKNITSTLEEHYRSIVTYLLEKIRWPAHKCPDESLPIQDPLEKLLKAMFILQRVIIEEKRDKRLVCSVFSEPLTLRFRFNFRGEAKTNNIYKPEWQFAYVNNLLEDPSDFFFDQLNSIIHSIGIKDFNIKHEVLRDIIEEIKAKLQVDFKLIQVKHTTDPGIENEEVNALIFHTLTEMIDFEKDLDVYYNYPNCQEYPRPMDIIFDSNDLFEKWKQLELDYARTFFKQALNSSDAWDRYLSKSIPEGDDPTKVPKHTITLIHYLENQRERCLHLGRHRYKDILPFYDGQKTLISDYIGELNYMLEDYYGIINVHDYSKLCMLTNATTFCKNTLCEWENNPFYLDLFLIDNQKEDVLMKSPFYDHINELSAFGKELIKKLAFYSLETFGTFFRKYINGTIKYQDGNISPPILDAIHTLLNGVESISLSLNFESFKKYCKVVTIKLSDMMFDRIKSKNSFKPESVKQIRIDMEYIIAQITGPLQTSANICSSIFDYLNQLDSD